ncbi:hypothetical protein ACQKH8_15210, partial [Staphylococcus aureus]
GFRGIDTKMINTARTMGASETKIFLKLILPLPFYTLSDYNELIEVAENEGKISSEDIQTLVEWRDNLA